MRGIEKLRENESNTKNTIIPNIKDGAGKE